MQMLELARSRIHAFNFLKCNPELVLVGSSGDLLVSLRLDVRVYPDCNGSDFFCPCCNPIDPFQLRLTFRIEAIDSQLKSQLDLRFRFAHARKSALMSISTSCQYSFQFPSANNIKAAAQDGQRSQYGQVGV